MTHDPRTHNMSNADSICWAFFLFFTDEFFKFMQGNFPSH